jgi:gliding motility-associated-like protein
VVFGASAGTTVISYSVTNACGTAVDTIAVTVHPLPSAGTITAASNSICNGTSFTLTNTTTSGTWTSSNTTIATIDPVTGYLSALATGATTISYTTAPNSFGCVNQTVFPLNVISPASFSITGTVDEIKCNTETNGSIAVIIPAGAGVGPYQYTWSNGSTSSSVTGLAEGAYTVVVKDMGTNCVDTQNFNIYMPSAIDITPVIKNSYCKLNNGSITLSVSGGTTPYSFAWVDGATTQDRTDLGMGSFSLVVTDKNLCTKQLTVLVDEDSCSTLVIHDVLTPNGDGKNDTWIIEGLYAYPNNSVEVFDKWGDAVFSGKKYENDWNGENRSGGMLPDGTYFYLVKLNADNVPGGKSTFTGSLLIKR